MAYVGFNLNNNILVRLDAKGVEILRKHYDTNNISPWLSKELEGMYKFQFHEFMNIYGKTGIASYAPYSTVVYLEKSDLGEKLDKVLK